MIKLIKIPHLFVVMIIVLLAFNTRPRTVYGDQQEYYKYKSITGTAGMINHMEFLYSDSMLLGDSCVLSSDLAKASVCLASASYDKNSVYHMLKSMANDDEEQQSNTVQQFNYEKQHSIDVNDFVAFTIGYKDVENTNKRIYYVVIRGTQEEEWFSNFNLGKDNGGKHLGFYTAAEEVIRILYALLSDEKENIIWITGHSRGAAVANIVSAQCTKDFGEKHVFCYTFACPGVDKQVIEYQNIFNFNNGGDMIPILPLDNYNDWQYQRFGRTYSWSYYSDVNAMKDMFFESCGCDYNGTDDSFAYEEILKTLIPHESDYFDPLKHFAVMGVAYGMLENSNTSFGDFVIKYGTEALDSYLYNIIYSESSFPSAISSISEEYLNMDKADKIIKQIKEDLNHDPTDAEFSTYKDNNWEVFDELLLLTGENIDKFSDLDPVSKRVLRKLNLAYKAGRIFAGVSDLLDHSSGKPINAIRTAHFSETYVIALNRHYFGYRAYEKETEENITIPSYVTSIGSSCFRYGKFESVSIPRTIKAVGEDAFVSCENLTEIVLPEGLESIGTCAMYGCEGIAELIIPNTVQEMGRGCLPGKLKRLTLPFIGASRDKDGSEDAVLEYLFNMSEFSYPTTYPISYSALLYLEITDTEVIPDYALYDRNYRDCKIEKVKLPASLKKIGAYAFGNCWNLKGDVNIPETVEEIGEHAFNGCSSLEGEIDIPDGITELKDWTFWGCRSLTAVRLPSTMKRIGECALYDCTGLKELSLPEGLESIGQCAMYGCEDITELIIPDSVQELGRGCLPGKLERLTLPFIGASREKDGSEDAVLEYMFNMSEFSYPTTYPISYSALLYLEITDTEVIPDYALYDRNYRDCKIEKVKLPASLKKIGAYAFGNCWNLKGDVNIPETVKEIGEHAFDGCSSLEGEIDIPDGITELKDWTFWGCRSLTAVRLPSTMKRIGECALYDCTGLKELSLPEGLESIGQCAMHECEGIAELIIPNTVKELGKGCLPRKLERLTLPFIGASREKDGSEDAVLEYLFNTSNLSYPPCNPCNYGSLLHLVITDTEVISDYACFDPYNNCRIKTIRLPICLRKIGMHAFQGCNDLRTINYPSKEIREFALEIYEEGNTPLFNAEWQYDIKNTVMMPNALMEISDEAFQRIAAEQIILHPGITHVGSKAFAGNQDLKYIIVEGENTEFEKDALEGLRDVVVYCKLNSKVSEWCLMNHIPYYVK